MARYRIAWLPGDGIGKDVMDAARIVLDGIRLDATYLPGDINADGAVDNLDLKILAASWRKSAGQPGYDLRADLNGDNRVDVLDLQIMAAHWGNN
jgi:hypothetical protein